MEMWLAWYFSVHLGMWRGGKVALVLQLSWWFDAQGRRGGMKTVPTKHHRAPSPAPPHCAP